ncbi:MAG: cell division protein ZapB [Thermodesulfobacteriota bacterium]
MRRQARAAAIIGPALALLTACPPSALAEPIRAEDAAAHVGEEVVVEGHVSNVVCSPLACLLSFATDFSGLVASIPGDRVAAFPPPKATYDARRVRVRGMIHEKAGRLRMELRDPSQIDVLDVVVGVGSTSSAVKQAEPVTPPPVPEATFERGDPEQAVDALAGEAPAPTPGPAAGDGSRIVDPGRFERPPGAARERREPAEGDGLVAELRRGGGEAMVEIRALREEVARLQETTRALSDTIAALQERLTVLEESRQAWNPGVDPSALPELHPYVVSGSRSTRLEPVRRGWSSERVLRVYGAPLNTTADANGFVTWYYSNGRAVTIDPRGRVSASVGF